MAARHIVITTFGSLGDLHPYLALAGELQRRGHRVSVATLPVFEGRVAAAGLAFLPLRATHIDTPNPEVIQRVFSGRRGVEYIVRTLLMPAVRTAYADTLAAARGADLLIGHPLTLTTPLAARVVGIPWISTQLTPLGLLSAHDPPMLGPLAWLRRLRAPRVVFRALFRWADRQTRAWVRPLDQLRAELGLPDLGNPLLAGAHSPLLELALFSRLLGEPQPDWPAQTAVTGFPFFEQPLTPMPALDAWLAAGPAPVLFTLGSSAVAMGEDFFAESVKAAQRLGRRALLLGVGKPTSGPMGLPLTTDLAGTSTSAELFTAPYASYAALFPRAAAVVHQGGVGTTAEALRSGRPMLVVPFGVDQPDNAARAARLGVARVLPRSRYRAPAIAAELRRLLEQPRFRERAAAVGQAVRAEHGARTACDLIEATLV